MATKPVVCPDCGALIPYGRFSCAECGALIASVAGATMRQLARADDARDEEPSLEPEGDAEVDGDARQVDEPEPRLKPSRVIRRPMSRGLEAERAIDDAPLEVSAATGPAGVEAVAEVAPDPPSVASEAEIELAVDSTATADVNGETGAAEPETGLDAPGGPAAAETVAAEAAAGPESDADVPDGAESGATSEPGEPDTTGGSPQQSPRLELPRQSETAPSGEAEAAADAVTVDADLSHPEAGIAASETGEEASGAEGASNSGEPANAGEASAGVPPAADTEAAPRPPAADAEGAPRPRPALPPIPGSYLPPSVTQTAAVPTWGSTPPPRDPPRYAWARGSASPDTASADDTAAAVLRPAPTAFPEPGGPTAAPSSVLAPRSSDVTVGDSVRPSVEAPSDLAGWTLAIGSFLAVIAFVLPWSSSGIGVIGASVIGSGYFNTWGLANPGNIVLVLFAAFVLALILVPNPVPVWLREGVVPIAMGGVDLGVWFTYVESPFGDAIGLLVLLVAGGLLAAGGAFALRPGRHVPGR